jgi:phospholipase C
VHAFDFDGSPLNAWLASLRSRREFKRHILLQGEFMIGKNLRCMAALLLAANLTLVAPSGVLANGPNDHGNDHGGFTTTTPIKHLVVIFQENVSFDHYYATYPVATNPHGETPFFARPNTPTVNGLTQGLIAQNHNSDGSGNTYPPFRLDPSENYTCDQNHDYTPEQQAFDSGLMDKFPEFAGTPCSATTYPNLAPLKAGIVMGYYDGNTVTGLWNYSQFFAMDDNAFDTNFGPSTPGAINVISGMTGNADPATETNTTGDVVDNSVIGDPDPFYDDCHGSEFVGMSKTNLNIGDLLNAKGITWGWFQGGFTPSTPATATTAAKCATTTNRLDGTPETAYSAHHNPFEYYASTANIHHTPPASLSEIGNNGPANHQYDLSYFQKAALAGNLPAVSYLKANRAQDGHPNNSSPLDEQDFIVNTLNFLQSLPEWSETAVIITWDDSDGWFDHVIGPIVNQSSSTSDALTTAKTCGAGVNSLEGIQSRCGYGPRLPFLLISPYSKANFVDHTVIDQSSVVRFIEDNWELPRIGNGSFDVIAGSVENMFDFSFNFNPPVFLNPLTGQVVAVGFHH